MSDPTKVLLGIIELGEAKRLRNLFQSRGIVLELVSNPTTCASGACGASVEVYTDEKHLDAFRDHVTAERARLLEGLEPVAGHRDAVFDPEQAMATCPACGTEFETRLPECPDCGLGFSSGEAEPGCGDGDGGCG